MRHIGGDTFQSLRDIKDPMSRRAMMTRKRLQELARVEEALKYHNRRLCHNVKILKKENDFLTRFIAQRDGIIEDPNGDCAGWIIE